MQIIITLLLINDEQINSAFMTSLHYKFMRNSQHAFAKNKPCSNIS